MNEIDNTYSRPGYSINGTKCLDNCYYANTSVIHPITGNTVTSRTNFCLVKPTKYIGHFGKVITEFEECLVPSVKQNLLTNTHTFNYNFFLKFLYNIESFHDAIKYIKNNKINIFAEIRIIDMCWHAFNKNIDNIPDSFYKYIKNDISKSRKFYIDFINAELSKVKNVNLNATYVNAKFDKFINDTQFVKTINRILKNHIQLSFDNHIMSHYCALKINIILFLIEYMNIDKDSILTIKNKIKSDINFGLP